MSEAFVDVVRSSVPRMESAVELGHELKKFQRSFLLVPSCWRNNPTRVKLDWKVHKFTSESLDDIPDERGVYLFVVSHKAKWSPPNFYVMYAGEVGNDKPHRTLKVRYKEYLREQKEPGRPHIHEMLNLWHEDIFFVCSTVKKSTDLKKLEARLIECMLPPYSEGDIPVGEIKKAVRVLRRP